MKRADQYLVENGFAASRSEAQAAIRAGLVTVDGAVLTKPSKPLGDGVAVAYRPPHPFVSRGGVKLAAALDHFELSPDGRIALDIGASTGGFTEVLLAGGAARVYAVDVGHDQLHPRLARDRRIQRRDGVNARALTAAHVMQFLAWEGLLDRGLKMRPMTLPDTFQDQDTPERMYEQAGFDANGIVATVLNALGRETEAAAVIGKIA